MNIFITGIAGFLGSNLAHYLLKKNYTIYGNDNFIGGYKDNLSSKFNFYNQEVKFATCSSGKARQLINYKTQFSLDRSIQLTYNYIKKRGPRKFDYKIDL